MTFDCKRDSVGRHLGHVSSVPEGSPHGASKSARVKICFIRIINLVTFPFWPFSFSEDEADVKRSNKEARVANDDWQSLTLDGLITDVVFADRFDR